MQLQNMLSKYEESLFAKSAYKKYAVKEAGISTLIKKKLMLFPFFSSLGVLKCLTLKTVNSVNGAAA